MLLNEGIKCGEAHLVMECSATGTLDSRRVVTRIFVTSLLAAPEIWLRQHVILIALGTTSFPNLIGGA